MRCYVTKYYSKSRHNFSHSNLFSRFLSSFFAHCVTFSFVFSALCQLRSSYCLLLSRHPGGVAQIGPTLSSLLHQEVLPDAIQINVPQTFRHKKASYEGAQAVPDLTNPLVRLHR